jgi:hypothetical protein
MAGWSGVTFIRRGVWLVRPRAISPIRESAAVYFIFRSIVVDAAILVLKRGAKALGSGRRGRLDFLASRLLFVEDPRAAKIVPVPFRATLARGVPDGRRGRRLRRLSCWPIAEKTPMFVLRNEDIFLIRREQRRNSLVINVKDDCPQSLAIAAFDWHNLKGSVLLIRMLGHQLENAA